jgi:Collagen triple helix repeat (20 copies)
MMMMLSAIRRRLTYTNVAVTLALVFAMSGGAYAASRYVITSTKQIKPSVLAQLKGKAGANGANGAQGPAGAQGPTGAQGPAGPAGPQGPAGATGETGKEGKAGTNGKNGANGKNGTFGSEPLPQGQTLRGVYAASGFGEAEYPVEPGFGQAITGVTFADAVPGEPSRYYIKLGEGEGEAEENKSVIPAHCKGNNENPGAVEGNLCVFAQSEVNVSPLVAVAPLLQGSPQSSIGFDIRGISAAKGYILLSGTWAVTAG